MSIDQNTLKQIIEQVVREMAGEAAAPSASSAPPESLAGRITVTETGPAERGTDPKEVVIALSPAFSSQIFATIIGLPHGEVLKQICAGIEEEGLRYRIP